jgi:hypothetical protein
MKDESAIQIQWLDILKSSKMGWRLSQSPRKFRPLMGIIIPFV